MWRILDASVLVRFWNKHCQPLLQSKTISIGGAPLRSTVVDKAKQLIQEYSPEGRTAVIVTPVAVEFLAGFSRKEDVELGELFLSHLLCIDQRQITATDWQETLRLAKRVPRDGRRRQLGDCLIRALANRLGAEVFSLDRFFP